MKWIWPSLLLFLSLHVAAQQTSSDDAYWRNWLAEAEVTAPKYAELCKIWKKTDGVPNAHLSQHEIDIVRYWETHQSDNRSGGNFPRMAAITAGNIKDAGSYDALEKLYLDPESHGEMVREEAFRAIAKNRSRPRRQICHQRTFVRFYIVCQLCGYCAEGSLRYVIQCNANQYEERP